MNKNPGRRVYLKMKELAAARAEFLAAFDHRERLREERVPVGEALGRVTASAIWATNSSPAWHLAAMDGIAINAEKSFGARPGRPVLLAREVDYWPVNTGHVLPAGANAVVMIEHVVTAETDASGRERVALEEAAFPWQHVRKLGEDVVAGELILAAGVRITPFHLGALAAGGIYEVPVRARPKVAIIPTGSELITVADARTRPPIPGQVVEFNSMVLAGAIRLAGGEPVVFPPCPDGVANVRQAIENAIEQRHDIILVNAGSSAGTCDHTVTAIAELGEVMAHGIAVMPGKPTVLGRVRNTPVIGNPGYPVSAVVSFEELVAPLIARFLGTTPASRPTVKVAPVAALPSKPGLLELVRVKLGRVGQRIIAVPLHRGAGSITSLTRADGIVRIPATVEGIEAEREVEAELLRPLEEVDGTIVVIGSHDPLIDVLGDLVHAADPKVSVTSGHVGSLGGLAALAKRQAHLAGSHLLDPATGIYNVAQVQRVLAGVPVKIVRLVERMQGFIVPHGNPKKVATLHDLTRPDIRFINRQGGSGTRVLLDYHLGQAGISPTRIAGYDSEEFTHTSVAAAVLSGRADVGLGVLSAARALSLDFVPLAPEFYELVIPAEYFDSVKIQTLLGVVRSPEFRKAAEQRGGYGFDKTGEVVWESPLGSGLAPTHQI